MVMFASILGSFLRLDLHTGNYVASLLLGTAPLYLIPVMVFIVSLLITLATGSAWGTFSLLIPITVQMIIALLQLEPPVAIEDVSLLFPTLGALLSGAACGNHIAPFAETTIMTATSTGIMPLVHARTQFAYAIPVIVGALCSFVIAGFLYDTGFWSACLVSLCVGVSVCVALLSAGNKFLK
jgi:Na+/H+ antiporter NhaC